VETHLADFIRNSRDGNDADAILRKCVHCGFCLATCPTYQVYGDELDSPRGRIYLIKEMLEGAEVTDTTRTHLDRCLSCRNCESTCPSGVQYGQLVDIGRRVVELRATRPRSLPQRALRYVLRETLTRPHLFAGLVAAGRMVRFALPRALASKLMPLREAGARPSTKRPEKVVLLEGCVQPALAPNINAACARVLDRLGIESLVAPTAGCCGAIRLHLDDESGAHANMRRNIDAWLPLLDAGATHLVMTASGCGAVVKEYARALRDDPKYGPLATRIENATCDLSELILAQRERLREIAHRGGRPRVAYHPPCTLQHWQQNRGKVEAILESVGATVQLCHDAHLCCGSAGTYSILQPATAMQLRDEKLKHLGELDAQVIASANIGCIAHLQSGTDMDVRHWIEIVDEAIAPI
jgi:glycolate oxidase iron-sulfur subunit